MSFRYQKRVRLGKSFGLNISNSGISSSYRTKYGTLGSKGFSIRTRIPGLSFRSNWGKSKEGFMIILTLGIIYLLALVIYNIALFLINLIRSGYATIKHRQHQ